MQYLYHPEASVSSLELTGDSHRYLFKVRRHKQGEQIYLRNLKESNLYTYLIAEMDKRTAILQLQAAQELDIKATKKLHIGWCIIDPKSIEKILPTLNEIGVEQITFFYCDRSQKQFKLDFARLEKILLNSSQQCGRSEMMKLDLIESLEKFIQHYPQSCLLHFSQNHLTHESDIERIVIGCEGGFSQAEVALFSPHQIVGLDTPLILRSESASAAIASKLLL